MISKGTTYENAVLAYGREWRHVVTITNGVTTETYDGASISIKEQFSDSAGFSIGGAFSTEVSITITQPDRTLDYLNSTYTIRTGIKLADTEHTWGDYADDTWGEVQSDPDTDTWEEMGNVGGIMDAYDYVTLGTFYPASVDDKEREITITLYDKMAQFDEVYDYGNMSFPTTTTALATAICTATGLTQKSALGTSYAVSGIPEKATIRQVIGWLAGTVGANAIINRSGQLEWRQYGFSGTHFVIDRDHEVLDETRVDGTFTINSITIGYDDETFVSGTGTGITMECPWATQAMATAIGTLYNGKTFSTGNVKWFGNPELEVGDVPYVASYNPNTKTTTNVLFPICSNTWTLQGGLQMDTACTAKADASYNFSTALSPTDQKITQVKTDIETYRAQLQQDIDGARGGIFNITDSNDDGINDGWILADNTNLSQATKLIKATSGGIGLSSDGGTTYDTAITGEGIYGNKIIAGTITADKIATTVKTDIVKETVVEYYLSSSSSSPTGGSWSETAPTWENGKYMWQRTKITNLAGVSSYSPSSTGTCVSGAKGEKGDDGTGIAVKADASSCTELGDAYINQDTTSSSYGHLMILTTVSPKAFTDGGQVKGQDGADGQDGTDGQDGSDGSDGLSVSAIEWKWALGTSSTEAPTTWYDAVQTMTESQKYLWGKNRPKFSDGSYGSYTTACVYGVYGTKGADGKSISVIIGEYQISSSSTTEPTTWQSSPPVTTTSSPYLWYHERVLYSDNTYSSWTAGAVIGVHGTNGKGVSGIEEQYILSSTTSSSTQTGSWSSTVPAMTNEYPYLWNRERVAYTDGTYGSWTSGGIVGAKGVDGTDGEDGNDGATGIGVSTIQNQYAVSSSGTTAPTTWYDAVQAMTVNLRYLWNRERVVYDTDPATYGSWSSGKVIGVWGDTGATGTGVDSITAQYYLSTSKTEATGGSWIETKPTWSSGKYLWFRYKVVYKNPTSTEYTVAYVDTSWEEAVDIQKKTIVETQTVYYRCVSGTASLAKPTTWITSTSDTNNAWTTVCPTYSTAYPVVFECVQSKCYDGTYSTDNCSTPTKNNMTAVLDGSHLTVGTIDAGVCTITNINASNINTGTLDCSNLTVTNLNLNGSFTSGTVESSSATLTISGTMIELAGSAHNFGRLNGMSSGLAYSDSNSDTMYGYALLNKDGNNIKSYVNVGKIYGGGGERGSIHIVGGMYDTGQGTSGTDYATKRGYEALALNNTWFAQFADPPRVYTGSSYVAKRYIGELEKPAYALTRGDSLFALGGGYYRYGTWNIGDVNDTVFGYTPDGGESVIFKVPLHNKIHSYQSIGLDSLRVNLFLNGTTGNLNTDGGWEYCNYVTNGGSQKTLVHTTTATGTAQSWKDTWSSSNVMYTNLRTANIAHDTIEVRISKADGSNLFSDTSKVMTNVMFPVIIYYLRYYVTDNSDTATL